MNELSIEGASSTPRAPTLFSQGLRRRWWQRAVQVAPVRVFIGILFILPGTFLENFARRPAALGIQVAAAAASVLAYLALMAGFARLVERRRPHELSRPGALLEWLAGCALGITLLAATVGILVAAGLYRVRLGHDIAALATGLVVFGPHSLLEEILLRALVFKITEEAVGSRVALVVQAALFGALHLGNPSATITAAIAIMLEAGLLLAIAYMVTRRLWLAWGIHLGWNYAQGSIFGIRVSGTPSTGSVLDASPVGSPLMSGGDFGVEASPIAVLVCLSAAALLWRAAVRRGEVVGYHEQRARLLTLR